MLEDQFITLIIPTRNRSKLLENIILSIINQTSKNWKLLIIDNASTDQTQELCLSNSKKYSQIEYRRYEEFVPIYENWARGIKYIQTDYFAILSDDDFVASTYVEEVLKIGKTSPDIMIVNRFSYSPLDNIDNYNLIKHKLILFKVFPRNPETIELKKSNIWLPYITAEILKENKHLFLHPTMFIYSKRLLKKFIKNYGSFFKSGAQDFRTNVIASLIAEKIIFLNRPLVTIGGLFYSPYCFTFNKFKYFGMDFKYALDEFDFSKIPNLQKILKFLKVILILN